MKWTADEIILCGKMGYRKAYKCNEKIWARTTVKEVLGDKIENLEYSQTKGIYTVKATYYYYTEKYDENGTLISRTKNPNHYRIDTNPYFTFRYDKNTDFTYTLPKSVDLRKFATRFKTTLEELPILSTTEKKGIWLFKLNNDKIGCNFGIDYEYQPYRPPREVKEVIGGKTYYHYYGPTYESKKVEYDFFRCQVMYYDKSTAWCGQSDEVYGTVDYWSRSFDGSFYMTHSPSTSKFTEISMNGSPLLIQSSPCNLYFCVLSFGLAGTVYSTFVNNLIFIPQRNNQLYMSKIKDLEHTGGDPIYGCENSVEYNL